MYLQSSTAGGGRAATPQGRAICDASRRFGDGETLPFAPCKRGYIPVVDGRRMYGCSYHSDDRRKRVKREGGGFRPGEKALTDFWSETGDGQSKGDVDITRTVDKKQSRKRSEIRIEVGELSAMRIPKKLRAKDAAKSEKRTGQT